MFETFEHLIFGFVSYFDIRIYRGCQKNVPIEDRFSATNPYTAIIFSEHYYDKRYRIYHTINVVNINPYRVESVPGPLDPGIY